MRPAASSRRLVSLGTLTLTVAVAVAIAEGGQRGKPDRPPDAGQVIRSRVDLVTSDVIVRDQRGRFVPNLNREDFVVHEDGVPQELVTLTMIHGGRRYRGEPTTRRAAPEGLVLPEARPTSDTAGRIFLIFVDDFHLNASDTPRLRDLFGRITQRLIHDGDMFGVISTGPSSIAIEMTYDRHRLEEAKKKISGAGLRPAEILETPTGTQGSPEVRHRAHVAFSTALETITRLGDIHDRRKAVIYLSNGYDFDPFAESRTKREAARQPGGSEQSPDSARNTGNRFAFADLAGELAAVTRAANRANASIYTIDPRGLVAGASLDDPVDMVEWQAHIRTSQDTLRVLADETGGLAIVSTNDFDRGLMRIDAETSDYYVIGYYSSNNDPMKRVRQIAVTVKRPGVEVKHRRGYSLDPR